MALARWKDLCVDAPTPESLAPFWAGVLGLRWEPDGDGDAVLRGERAERTVWVNTVPEAKTAKNRVHLDVVLPTYQPLVEAKATFVDHRAKADFEFDVLTDPDGNEMCVFPPGSRSGLVTDAGDAVALARWWADVLGARLVPGPDGTPRWLAEVPGLPWDLWKFVPVPEPKSVKNRWHWDLVCDDVDALVARGARVLRRPDEEIHWHVLADPEGNEFCAFAS